MPIAIVSPSFGREPRCYASDPGPRRLRLQGRRDLTTPLLAQKQLDRVRNLSAGGLASGRPRCALCRDEGRRETTRSAYGSSYEQPRTTTSSAPRELLKPGAPFCGSSVWSSSCAAAPSCSERRSGDVVGHVFLAGLILLSRIKRRLDDLPAGGRALLDAIDWVSVDTAATLGLIILVTTTASCSLGVRRENDSALHERRSSSGLRPWGAGFSSCYTP